MTASSPRVAPKPAPVKVTASAPLASVQTTVYEEVGTLNPIEAFRAALAIVDAGDARGDAGATLKSLTLDRFRHAADRPGRTANVKGFGIMRANVKKDVQGDVWRDAGFGTVPVTADRTPGQKSLATYLSQMATVATNFDHGTAALADVESLEVAAEAIRDEAADLKATRDRRALLAFIATLPKDDAAALTRAHDILTGAGKDHAPAWVKRVTDANRAK